MGKSTMVLRFPMRHLCVTLDRNIFWVDHEIYIKEHNSLVEYALRAWT